MPNPVAKTNNANRAGLKKISLRQRVFLKKYLETIGRGSSKSEALIIAHKAAKYKGVDDESRRTSAYTILQKCTASATFTDLLKQSGLDEAQLAANVTALTQCEKPVLVGKDRTVEMYPDNYCRIKANELAMRHLGLLERGGVAVQVNILDRAGGQGELHLGAHEVDVTPA